MALKSSARDLLMVVLVGLILLGGLGLTLAGTKYKAYSIPAGSMIPAIAPGEKVMVDLRAYDDAKPARGDVVVFRFPKDESISYVKRVVGLPGDEVEFREKVLYLNGKEVKVRRLEPAPAFTDLLETSDDVHTLTPFEEDLDGHQHVVFYNMTTLMNSDYASRRIPEGQYLMLGDNRDKSSDSRFWGFVREDAIIGKVSFVYWSWHSGRIGAMVR